MPVHLSLGDVPVVVSSPSQGPGCTGPSAGRPSSWSILFRAASESSRWTWVPLIHRLRTALMAQATVLLWRWVVHVVVRVPPYPHGMAGHVARSLAVQPTPFSGTSRSRDDFDLYCRSNNSSCMNCKLRERSGFCRGVCLDPLLPILPPRKERTTALGDRIKVFVASHDDSEHPCKCPNAVSTNQCSVNTVRSPGSIRSVSAFGDASLVGIPLEYEIARYGADGPSSV